MQSLLKELLLLIGFFALLEPRNQQVLLWGREPTVVHKLGSLPFAFFCDPKLAHVLLPTLLAVTLHSDHVCEVGCGGSGLLHHVPCAQVMSCSAVLLP